MKKYVVLILAAALLLSLSGCGCSHQWLEATCEKPRTCSNCGATEGEALPHSFGEATCAAPSTCGSCGATEGVALPHTLTEANFQEAAVCTVCHQQVGEPLTPGFVEMGAVVNEVEKNVPHTITINGTRYSYCITAHEIIPADQEHPEVAGYAWHRVAMQIDALENQASLGYNFYIYTDFTDYYDPMGQNASVEVAPSNALLSLSFTTNYGGQDYDQCLMRLEDSVLITDGSTWSYTETIAFRIPQGYDGLMIAAGDSTRINSDDYNQCWNILYRDANTVTYRLR